MKSITVEPMKPGSARFEEVPDAERVGEWSRECPGINQTQTEGPTQQGSGGNAGGVCKTPFA